MVSKDSHGPGTAPSASGPWERIHAPILDSNPNARDNSIITNPSACIAPVGRIRLYYRSSGCKLSLAVAKPQNDPFERYGKAPVVDPGHGLRIEDPFVWWMNDHYEMVCKDLTGKITGEFHAAVHLFSNDGVDWKLANPPKAWFRKLTWEDGRTTIQGSIERPYILFENNQPAWLFAATADGPGPSGGRPGHFYARNTWNLVIPLGET